MLKHEFQALFRAPWRTGLFALLLAAAVAAASLGGGLLAATDTLLVELAEKYTTVAVLRNDESLSTRKAQDLKLLADETRYGHVDRRNLYGGYIPGVHTATSLKEVWEHELNKNADQYSDFEKALMGYVNPSRFDWEYDRFSAVVTCLEDFPEQYDPVKDEYYDGYSLLRVDEVLSVHESFDVPETVEYCYLLTYPTPFKPGKQYLIGNGALNYTREQDRPVGLSVVYRISSENPEPQYDMAEMTGTLEEMLAGENGTWLQGLIRECEVSNNSITVIATERLNSILPFNQRELGITQGRDFTAKEYAEGAPVCILSELLAQMNGLTIGDTLTMELYRYDVNEVPGETAWSRSPFDIHSQTLETPREYTIIGMFNTPAWDFQNMKVTLSPNTAIIPAFDVEINKNSPGNRLITTGVIVQNGHGEDFLAEMEALEPGSSNHFVIYDQGYSEVAPAMEAFAKNARLVAAGCAAVFALAGGMFLALARAKHRHDLGVMRSLGATKQKAFSAFLVRCAVPVLFGGALGCAAAQLLFGRAVALLGEEGLVAQPVGAMWLIALGCALALTGLAAAVGAGLVKKKPQELMQEGKE